MLVVEEAEEVMEITQLVQAVMVEADSAVGVVVQVLMVQLELVTPVAAAVAPEIVMAVTGVLES
jgi:hypothetical protein